MATQIWWHPHAFLARRGTRCMVYHHAPGKSSFRSFTKSGLAPCGQTLPFSFVDFTCSKSCNPFRLFQLSNFSTFQPQVAHSSPSTHLSFNRPSLVASYAPSDTPEPLCTSVLCGRCRIHRCRPILTSGEEILAILELRTGTVFSTTNRRPSTINDGL